MATTPLLVLGASQTIQYVDLIKAGFKVPYGKEITIVGTVSEVSCGANTLGIVFTPTAVTATYLGRQGAPTPGTIAGKDWHAPIGTLAPGTSVSLQVVFFGTLTESTRKKIVGDLIIGPQFQRSRSAFSALTTDQPSSVVVDEAQRFLRGLLDEQGELTHLLRRHAPCISAGPVTELIASRFSAALPAISNLLVRLQDVSRHELLGVGVTTTPAEVYDVVSAMADDGYKKQDGTTLNENDLAQARRSVQLYVRDFRTVIDALGAEVVVQLAQNAVLNQAVDTTELEKYAGFDIGAGYLPRMEELQQLLMVHIYPFGPVELDPNGQLSGNFKSRFSIALGVSMGDFSGRTDSRIKDNNAFIYGLGWRVNKFFRISAGAGLYRESSARNGLLHEFFVSPSIDITALPGLRQIFARGVGN